MVQVTYIEHDGTAHTVEADDGKSLMEVAVEKMISGIDGDCGGACACATCHIYVDEAWLSKVGEKSEMEASMLDFAEGVTEASRLACQITAGPGVDGIVVRLPESQH